MYAQVEKPKENRSKAVANSIAQKKDSVKQSFGFVDNREKFSILDNSINSNQQLKRNIWSSEVVQLKPVNVTITGITHLVKIAGRSIMNGIEGPEVSEGDKAMIDSEIKYRSRRGPNQENQPGDEQSEHIYRWFKVLRFDDVAEKDNYFIRDGTFLTKNINEFGSRPAKIHESHRVRGQAPSQSFQVNKRTADWGKVVEVAPGVGVEVHNDQSDDYVSFIYQQIQKIQGSEVGLTLLHQFDPTRLGEPFRQVQDQDGPLRGITVLIGQPPPRKEPTRFNSNPNRGRVINTIEQGGHRPDGKKSFGAPEKMIPRINYFDRPEKGREEQIGDTNSRVTNRGIEGHRDFPSDIQPFDTVLFHELVHAYISQIGVARRLRGLGDNVTNTLPLLTKDPDSIEEQLVVGLAGGAGHYLSENRYRMEQRQQIRGTYLANQLDKNSDKGTLKTWLQGVSIQTALERAGLTPEQAIFVAGGH